MKWWLLSSEELQEDQDAQLAKQNAYFEVFYSSANGREVLNDIRELCYSSNNVELISMYNTIRNCAGRTRLTELNMIEAEAKAIVFEHSEEEETTEVEGDKLAPRE